MHRSDRYGRSLVWFGSIPGACSFSLFLFLFRTVLKTNTRIRTYCNCSTGELEVDGTNGWMSNQVSRAQTLSTSSPSIMLVITGHYSNIARLQTLTLLYVYDHSGVSHVTPGRPAPITVVCHMSQRGPPVVTSQIPCQIFRACGTPRYVSPPRRTCHKSPTPSPLPR